MLCQLCVHRLCISSNVFKRKTLGQNFFKALLVYALLKGIQDKNSVAYKSFSCLSISLGVKNYQINRFFWSKICVIKSQQSLGNKKVNKCNEYCENWPPSEMSSASIPVVAYWLIFHNFLQLIFGLTPLTSAAKILRFYEF